jgi:hypothetical protein
MRHVPPSDCCRKLESLAAISENKFQRQLRVTTARHISSATLITFPDGQRQHAGGGNMRGHMTISTLIMVLLLTFGAASALDRFVQSQWVREALLRVRIWGVRYRLSKDGL